MHVERLVQLQVLDGDDSFREVDVFYCHGMIVRQAQPTHMCAFGADGYGQVAGDLLVGFDHSHGEYFGGRDESPVGHVFGERLEFESARERGD